MSILSSPRFLRAMVGLDAASCLAIGAAHLLLGSTLASWLALPPALLTGSGWAMLACAALAGAVLWLRPLQQNWLRLLVGANVGWAVVSAALLLVAGLQTNLWGQAYLLVHAVTVGLLAELQWMGLRRGAAASAVHAAAAW